MTRGRDHGGFSLVEVIIVSVLVLVAGTILMQAIGSSGRSLTAADITTRETEIARAALQRLREDGSWADAAGCARSWQTRSACSVTGSIDQALLRQGSTSGQVQYVATGSALGIDSADDGLMPNDADRRVPDRFEVTVTVRYTGSARTDVKPVRLTAGIDPATRLTGGVLKVTACAIDGQIDERLTLDDCRARRSLQLEPPLAKSGTSDRDVAPFNAAPAWAKEIVVRPVGTSCSAAGPGRSVALSTGGDGTWTSPSGLPSGRWRVTCSTPSGYDPWSSHTRPADGVVEVEEGRTSALLFAFQPEPRSVTLQLGTIHFDRYRICMGPNNCTGDRFHTSFNRSLTGYDHQTVSERVQLVPAPYGRVTLGPAITASSGSVTLSGLPPGLYGNTLVINSAQYYLYTARPPVEAGIPYNFSTPLQWLHVAQNGTVTVSPTVAPGGVWAVRWWCHSGEYRGQMRCPDGPTPAGRGALNLGGAGGRGGT